MKHNNESISRLDGDIYELCTGQFIDMRSIISVGNIEKDADRYGTAFIVHCRLLENPIYVWYDDITEVKTEQHFDKSITQYLEIDRKKTYEFVEERRLEFVEVWKHWKQKSAGGE